MKRTVRFTLYVFFVLLIFVQCSIPRAASNQYTLPESYDYHIQGQGFSMMDIDQVGNMYLVRNQRTLLKYMPDGTLDKTFDSQLGGFIYSIDVTNPLYLLVYYRDAGKITLFDRNLAPLQEISIAQWTKNDITAVSLSNNNQLWMYDAMERRLTKYSIEGKKIIESADLYGLTSLSLSVEYIREYNNRVYMRNSEGKLIVLDNLGRFLFDVDVHTGLPLRSMGRGICFPKGSVYGCLVNADIGYEYVEQLGELGVEDLRVIVFGDYIYVEGEDGVIKKRN